MAGTLDQVLKELKLLNDEERRRVRAELDVVDSHSEPVQDDHSPIQSLSRESMILSMPLRRSRASTYSRPAPIKVNGKPVSETLIEEGR